MKKTGVVRRIDDLGRVVIPKEIRKTLRIKDGESLEIFLDSDNIILKKFSNFDDLEQFYKNYIDSLYSVINENVMITDCDKVLAMSGTLKKVFFNRPISKYIESVIESRENVFINDFKNVELVNGIDKELSYTISPIIANGDCVGTIIIFSEDNRITDFERKAVLIASKFLGKYVES